MWLPLLALLIGLVIGLQFSFTVPEAAAPYTAVAILAAMDAILGAMRADLDRTYANRIFVSGLVANVGLALLLTYLGDRLGVNLALAAIVAFGVRMFTNLAIIRRHFL